MKIFCDFVVLPAPTADDGEASYEKSFGLGSWT